MLPLPRLAKWFLLGLLAHPLAVHSAMVRVKDVAVISGARENQLSGLGLVYGLAGDGDRTLYTRSRPLLICSRDMASMSLQRCNRRM